MGLNLIDANFWSGKRVFLTGHTGFKGSWLSIWLSSMGSEIKGYSLEPNTDPSLYYECNINDVVDSQIGDIRNIDLLKKSMTGFDPDILIHMAAQPLVRRSYDYPLETYTTNVIGTANVLESARYCSNLRAIISVTTDKVYDNKEWAWGYRENEPLGGYDPYSSSKACAELVTSAYRSSYFLKWNTHNVASARAGNVVGGGDWSKDRLIPDFIRSVELKEPMIVRNPLATRPWQHVLEPLSGYILLAQKLFQYGERYADSWNFGPNDEDCKSVEWILDELVRKWKGDASWELDKNQQPHEAKYLKLDCSKVKSELGWEPKWDIKTTIGKIYLWYQALGAGEDMQSHMLREISSYQK